MNIPRPKKILLVSHLCRDNFLEGAGLYLLWLGEKISQYGLGEPVFLSPGPGSVNRLAEVSGLKPLIRHYDLFWDIWNYDPDIERKFSDFVCTNALTVKALQELFIASKIDLVVVNCLVNPLPAVAASRLGIPVIWNIHETLDPFNGDRHKIMRLFNRRQHKSAVSGILRKFSVHLNFVSNLSFESFSYKNNLRGHSSIIPPPVRDYLFQDALLFTKREEPEMPVIGFAGTHVKHKGIEDFLKAAGVLIENGYRVRFLVCGADSSQAYRVHLKDLISKYKLEGHIEMLGLISDMRGFYRKIDIFVMPSSYLEPYGMVAAEAMAYGIPVIIYRKSGAGELIKNGENGFLIRGDYRLIVNGIIRLLEDVELRRNVGVMASRSVRERLSPDRIFGEYLNIIERSLATVRK